MNSIDYALFERVTFGIEKIKEATYDVFISAYNDSERVQTVFKDVVALSKVWTFHSEYGYNLSETAFSSTEVQSIMASPEESAIDFWQRVISEAQLASGMRIAIDITGMMRPHILIMPLVLSRAGIQEIYVFYSDPAGYESGGSTVFSKGPVESVRTVPGLEGIHKAGPNVADILIIGAGYDHELIRAAAESRRSADHYLLVGLPSLQAHMYQESLLRISQVRESIQDRRSRSFIYAPANDPFVTAHVLSEHVESLRKKGQVDNIYLCPVGAKTQVLGFSWYFYMECIDSAASMVFPVSAQYSKETSNGLTAIHRFKLEFNAFQ